MSNLWSRREVVVLSSICLMTVLLAWQVLAMQPSRARVARSLLNMRAVSTAMLMAAGSRSGEFPEAKVSALEAYRVLLKNGYLPDASFLAGEGSTPLMEGSVGDLKAEHVGFAYVTGLRSDTVDGVDYKNLPLLITKQSGLSAGELHKAKLPVSSDNPWKGSGVCVAFINGAVAWVEADEQKQLASPLSPTEMPRHTAVLEP